MMEELAEVASKALQPAASFQSLIERILTYGDSIQARDVTSIHQEVERLQEGTRGLLSTQESFLRDTYGLVVDSVVATARVDQTGNLHYEKELKGVKVTSQAQFSLIPVEGKLWGPGALVPGEIGLLDYNFPRPVRLRTPVASATHKRGGLHVEGGLGPDDPPLDFTIAIEVRRAFTTSREEAEETYKGDIFPYERFGEDVFLPVSNLMLELHLPSGMAKDVFAVAFFGYSEVQMPSETVRVRPFLEQIGSISRLTVPSPLYGFRYGICWSLAR